MKITLRFPTLFPVVLLVSLTRVSAAPAGSDPVDFNRDIRPILSDNCFACHGLDEKDRKADLRLDTPEGAFADLGGYQAIVPGKLEEGAFWERIISKDEDEIMPPPESHKKLKPRQIALLKRWIEEGALYADHWSFEAPVNPPVPPLAGGRNPIDAFLRARLKKKGMTPSSEADKITLIRRVTLDLTGLPPTPEEVDAFLADESPDAYERLVDELMTRVTYGEHMARPWLDLARYADTHGLHLDNERSMWPYRDWVARAFNQNVRFDDFTRWQLAGDLLDNPTREQLIASGFNRCNVTTSEGGSIKEEWVYRYAVDRTSTTVEVWMGMTAGCAVCHDHKFDPISMKEYYSMYSFFHSAADPAMDGNRIDTPPIMKIASPGQEAQMKKWDAELAELNKRFAEERSLIAYVDPALQSPPPAAGQASEVWFDEDFPDGVKVQVSGENYKMVHSRKDQVFCGEFALKKSAEGLEQVYFQRGGKFEVPANGLISAYCFLDPEDVPEGIMLQFHTKNWDHRAVWGDEAKVTFGTAGKPSKVVMGDLPEAGNWARLEIKASRLGLKPGEIVTGLAFTQFGGTVSWDKVAVDWEVDVARDPNWSFSVWKQENEGKNVAALPDVLKRIVKEKRVQKWTEKEHEKVYEFWLGNIYKGSRALLEPLRMEKAALEKTKTDYEKKIPVTFVMADLPKPRESFVMLRGAYDNPGEKVSRGVPEFLPELPSKPEDRDYNRLDFANWLVSGEHPLTARVTVNRFWQQFFGSGLVKTGADFGSQGEPPSHPDLLDWLAVHFVESGWDVKEFVKLIVTSAAYRQDSRVTPEHLEKDPENRLLARAPRLRLDAEVLRDQALFLSGLLVDKIGGKGVNPYQPPNIWEPVGFGNSNTRNYKQGTGDDLYRRSLYTFFKRTAPPPFMSTFDAPNREQSCSARGRSNTPLQALQLMNDIQHFEAARNLAERMIREGGKTPDQRIRWVWRMVTSRIPQTGELELVKGAYSSHLERYREDPAAATELISCGESKTDDALDPAHLAAYTMVANLVLNLDETVTKN